MTEDRQFPDFAKPRRRWLWNIPLAMVIFICGAAVGGGLTFKIVTGAFQRSFQNPSVRAEHITRRMQQKLDLTEDQTTRVRTVLLRNLKAIQALRTEFRPRLIAQIVNTRQELDAVLTPEQRRKLDKRFRFFMQFWLPQEKNPPEPGEQ